MKKLLIALGILVLLVVGAVFVVPSFVDWNEYKPTIAEAVRDATGRELAIDGDIDLSILPTPTLKVNQVRLANVPGAENPDMVRLKTMEVEVGLGDLLEGKLAVRSLTLVEPQIALEVTKDGQASWELASAADPEASGQPADGATGTPDPDTPDPDTSGQTGDAGAPMQISLDHLRIEQGSLVYRDAQTGTTERIENLDATIVAESLRGPFDVVSSFRTRGVLVSVNAKTGRPDEGQPIPMSLQFRLPEANAQALLRGTVSEFSADGLFEGTMTAEADNAAAAAEAVAGPGMPALLGQTFALQSKVSAARDSVGLNDMSVSLGSMNASGALNAALGQVTLVDLALTIRSLDLDELLAKAEAPASPAPNAGSGAGGSGGSAGSQPASPDTSGRTASAPGGGFSMPTGLQATVDLSADVVKYKKDAIRKVGVTAELSDGVLTLTRAEAELPGTARASLTGTVQPSEGQPVFTGKLDTGAENLRGLLDWLAIDTTGLPRDRFRRFAASGQVKATPSLVELSKLRGSLDTVNFDAGLSMALRKRPAFGVWLSADKVDLDAYLPARSEAGGAGRRGDTTAGPKDQNSQAQSSQSESGAPATDPAASAAGRGLPDLSPLNGFDANVQLEAGQLTYNDVDASKVKADLEIYGGKVTIRELSVGDVGGARGMLKGSLTTTGKTPKVDLSFDLATQNVAKLFQLAGETPPAPAQRLGALSANGTLAGDVESAKLAAQVAALNGKFRVDGTVRQPMSDPQVDATIDIAHPELAQLLAVAAPDYKPAAQTLGPVKIGFRAQAAGDTVSVTNIDGSLGPVAVTGSVEANSAGKRPYVKADLRTSEVLVDLFAPRAGSAAGTGRSGSGSASGSGSGGSSGGGSSASGGGGRWSGDRIDLSGFQSVDADVTLVMAALTKDPVSIDKPSLKASLKNGRLEVQEFAGKLFDGDVQATAVVDTAGETPRMAMNLEAKQVRLGQASPELRDLQVQIGPLVLGGSVDGPVSLTTSLQTVGASERALVNALNGTAKLDGTVNMALSNETKGLSAAVGIAGAILGQQVRELQGVTQLTTLSNRLVRAFGTKPNALSGDYTITDGVVKTENTILNGADARLVTTGTASLPAWQIDTTSNVRVDETQEAALTVDLTGALDKPNVRANGPWLRQATQTQPQQTQQEPQQQPLPRLQDLLQGRSPEQQPSQPAPDQQQQQQQDPQQMLNNLLRGFGR